MHSTELTRDSVVVASRDQGWCDVGGEAAILHIGQGMYYGVNGIGTRIWELLQAPTSVTTLRDALATEYEVDPTLCETDLLAFLRELHDAQLIERR